MVVGEFTVSNIAMEEDKREEDKAKTQLDMDKFNADLEAGKGLAMQGQLQPALDALLGLEKQARGAEDLTAGKAACTAILEVCKEAGQWQLLEENVQLLAKRRGQLKQVIQSFVRQAMGYIDATPNKEAKVSLIKCLQSVTEGKIFVEIERARLTRKLAAMKEAEGAISEAADILQEVAVETFGAMAKTEKVAFILEQMRLCLAKKDFVRAQILSRKVSPKAFVQRKGEGQGEVGIEGSTIEEAEQGIPTLPELKLIYYRQLIQYYSHADNWLEIARCYRALYESEGITDDAAQWPAVLKKVCWFLVLTPAYSTPDASSSDAATLVAAAAADKRLSDLPAYKQLLATFQNQEIIRWQVFQAQYAGEVAAEPEVFAGEDGPRRAAALKLRVVEHNLLVVGRYYRRIRLGRLAQLLDLSPADAEARLSELVVAKALNAKVDRPAGIVTIQGPATPEAVLNEWSGNIARLLELVEKGCQQIQKEAMVHKVALPTTA